MDIRDAAAEVQSCFYKIYNFNVSNHENFEAKGCSILQTKSERISKVCRSVPSLIKRQYE